MSRNAKAGYVTREPFDPRERFSLWVLCQCIACGGKGKVEDENPTEPYVRCPDCRGEGKTRVELATCETPEAVGVALVTLAREDEWKDADGNPCALGLLERMPECETCHGARYLERSWLEHGSDEPCPDCKGTGVKPTGTWLILPWLASPRNVSDAGRTLAKSRRQ